MIQNQEPGISKMSENSSDQKRISFGAKATNEIASIGRRKNATSHKTRLKKN